uniref:Uncharacterized protein n=1 Tax=Corynebacterium phage HS03 TaxID=3056390 RepID=A0AA49X7V7_9VIRU|nr:MAG: hypothetical protein [Corynebacterium phage HS03]
MHPLIADGGEMTILRDLAAFSYGRWSVDWPESVPEEQRPELPDDRDFGYASKLKKDPGRFGRRFVRADVQIKAQDFDEAGKPIPFSGESDVEETLDDAAKRTDGDVFFEREITRAGLGALQPRVDFDVDSVVPVLIWGKTIPSPVTSIEDVVEQGAVVDYRVHVGGQLLQDDAARERANREVEATIAQERRERVKAVSRESKARKSAISAEARRSDAYADAAAARVEKSLVQASKDLSDEIARTVKDADFAEYSAELQERLWGAQGEFNKITSEFQEKQEQINAQQQKINEQQRLLDAAQSKQAELTRQLTESNKRAINMLALQNHGALYIQDKYTLPAREWTILDFSGVRGKLKGCRKIGIGGTGTGFEFLSPGDWDIRLRVNIPDGEAIIGTTTGLRLTVMPKDGSASTDRATSYSYNNAFDQTLTVYLTASIPESGCYVYAEGYASTTSGNSKWWPSDTGPELTEFSVRQLSYPELS